MRRASLLVIAPFFFCLLAGCGNGPLATPVVPVPSVAPQPPAKPRATDAGPSADAAHGQPPTAAAAPAARPPGPAAELLASAAKLERLGKKAGAIDAYRVVYMRYLGSPAADQAARSIVALGGKVPDDMTVRAFRERDKTLAQRAERKAIDAELRRESAEKAERERRELAARAAASASVPSGGKTVHVRGYTRRDGTYVRPHSRRVPSR